MTIIAPADSDEMKQLMPLTVDHSGPIYIRLAKGYDPIVSNNNMPFKIGKAIPMTEGNDALIVTTGITLKIALDASNSLKDQGIQLSVLHMPTIKPLDIKSFMDYANQIKVVIAIEEHSIVGGLGSSISEIISESNFKQPKRFKRLGLPDVFPDEYGSQTTLMERYMITKDHLINTIKELLS